MLHEPKLLLLPAELLPKGLSKDTWQFRPHRMASESRADGGTPKVPSLVLAWVCPAAAAAAAAAAAWGCKRGLRPTIQSDRELLTSSAGVNASSSGSQQQR
jgi:hypothetical protein